MGEIKVSILVSGYFLIHDSLLDKSSAEQQIFTGSYHPFYHVHFYYVSLLL